jgi:hypothetical protein
LPLPVILNRLAAPLCVFIFGMVAVVSSFSPPGGSFASRSGPALMTRAAPPFPVAGVNLYASVGV